MEAKDTVGPVSELFENIWCPHCSKKFSIEAEILCEREVQAEISFKAGIREVVEEINKLHLFVGDCPPKEGEKYVYLGDYILRYGKNLEPQVGFYRLSDLPQWQAKLKEWFGEEIKHE